MHGSELRWIGCGKKKITFTFDDERELFINPVAADHPDLSRLFPQEFGKYSLNDIAQFSHFDIRAAAKKLWESVWVGLVTNDTFASVRQGLLSDFTVPFSNAVKPRRYPISHNRWGAAQPFPGNWFVIPTEILEKDPIDDAELVKDRVRQLFRRYGILFRELVAAELPPLQWSAIFRALHIMELSGEILSGYFFEGIPGVQFISHEAYRFLRPGTYRRCHLLDKCRRSRIIVRHQAGRTKKHHLPSRIATTHLVFHGNKLVLVSRRGGSTLTFHVSPDHPCILEYLNFFKVLVSREFAPEKIITVEMINGESALQSDYASPLKDFGFSSGYKGLELVKKYGS